MTPEWWRLTINCDPDEADAIAAAIVADTGNGVEEPAAGALCTTLETRDAADGLLRELSARFRGVQGAIARVEPIDWSTRWRDGIVARAFGRLILTPSWIPVEADRSQVVVTIDPESAFGSGEHGSTRGALALLERHLRPGDRMIDLGSGSGILAIAAVRLGARSAIGIEIDDGDIPVAEANARKNDAADRTRFLCGDAADLAPLAGPADVVCSNILRSVNTLLVPAILDALTPAGTAIFAGMEEAEESLFGPVLAGHGLLAIDEVRDGGWWSVAARRP